MLKNKANGKKGFTLAELLIVVAIIGILVAISMPIFSSQLNKSKKATDDANLRAAKGIAVNEALNMDTITSEVVKYYDAENGKLVGTPNEVKENYGKVSGHTIIKVTIKTDGTVVAEWATGVNAGTEPTTPSAS